ncbi:MAG: threonine ammonia-lyase, biosynthetic [Pseudomonadota bacterium]
MDHYLRRILTARVYDVAHETPCDRATNLSHRLNNHIYLKREDTQPVFSFKIRGAYNKMAQLTAEQLKKGVIAASAGNHAQGVALSAQHLGCSATIVMPTTTPAIKIDAVANRGAHVVLFGDSYSDAYAHALELAKANELTFVHPYDDPDVIAGQGTIGMEILRQVPRDLDAIFIAVGGGGLISGIGAYIKSIRPDIKIIGVEPVDSDAMSQSLAKNERVVLKHVGLFADGVAVKQVGEETFRLCKKVVDEMIQVDNDSICAAIKDIFEDTRTVMEPAGALSVAGLKDYLAKHQWEGKKVVAIACGANINFDRLRFVAERAELGEAREAVLAVTIPEHRGSFKEFCNLLGKRAITEFNYRYADNQNAHIFVGLQTKSKQERHEMVSYLEQKGLGVIDLTENELAKLHIRHLVGGHSPQQSPEIVYRFTFPERPGALMDFLNSMSNNWNITLFHYRNHGSDFARVLVGMQIPDNEQDNWERFLQQLGYDFVEETDNPAYLSFLGAKT